MNEEENKKYLEIAKGIGYKVGTYCNDEEVEVFEKFLEDYKYKSDLIEKQQAEIEKKDKIIDYMAEKINQAYFEEDDFEEWFEKMLGVQKQIDYGYVVDLIKQYFNKKIEKGE